MDGQEISSPEQQGKSFAQYYEELSVPKNENYDSALLKLCTVRHELITQYCDENPMTLDPITKSEVKEAISRLNRTKKATDEFGLTAEHLKHAGNSVIDDITDTFDRMICEKQIPEAFKIGILTPVLKKSKSPSNMDSYADHRKAV